MRGVSKVRSPQSLTLQDKSIDISVFRVQTQGTLPTTSPDITCLNPSVRFAVTRLSHASRARCRNTPHVLE